MAMLIFLCLVRNKPALPDRQELLRLNRNTTLDSTLAYIQDFNSQISGEIDREARAACSRQLGDVMDIRDTVKGVSDDTGILKSFGIGEKIQKNVSSVTAAGNMVLQGYADHTEWANNEAGILDEDIEIINADVLALSTADTVQEGSKFQRKASTMDKNTLQRRVEDLVTKISVIGIRVFRKKDPAVVALFEGLIP